jgi:hypothetical protein
MPMLWELKKAYCGFLDTSSMKGGQVAAVGGGGGGGQKSSVSQRHKKNQGHLSQAIFEASIAVAVANSVSDLNSRMCTLAATESWRSLEPEGSSSQSVDVMEVMAESPGDVEYSTQYADAISMIAENESHGSREQECQEGISLILDVQNGADTDEH